MKPALRAGPRKAFRTPHAFGLLEMLVAIGLVAVLCLLFFPAIQRMRERSKQVVCLGNLRQLYAAMATYAGDHQGYFPKAHEIGDEKSLTWLFALEDGQYIPRFNRRHPWNSLHICPSMSRPPDAAGNYSPSLGNYAANRTILGFYNVNGRKDDSTPLSRIRNPGSKLLLFEYGGTYAFWLNIFNFSAPNYIPGHPENATKSWPKGYRQDAVEGRHGPTINLIHVDGSAATVLPAAFLEIPEANWEP